MTKISPRLIDHKLTSPLVCVSDSHAIIRDNSGCYDESDKRDATETIIDARFLFRSFLEDLLSNIDKVSLPEKLSGDKLREIYRKSDFDWLNYERYVCFLRDYDIESSL